MDVIATFEAYIKPSISVFALVVILSEVVALYLRKVPADVKTRKMNVACFVITSVGGGLFHAAVAYHIHSYVYRFRLFDLGFAWYAWLTCFLLIDAMFYVTHRMHHRIRLLWCVHSVHHSAESFELTTGIRGSLFDTASQFPVYAWLPLVGIHPMMYRVTDTVFKFLIFIYHTEFVQKLGFLEKIVVTPASHRVHHGTNIKYLDRNYGGVFILFDRWLGTYEPEDERPTYGVRKNPATSNVLKTQFGEFAALWRDVAAAPTLRDKFNYVIKPPGWRHDGQPETSEWLRLQSPLGPVPVDAE